MAASFGWGLLAASSLVIGALIALRFRISLRVIGLIMGFGAGVLISAVAFDLIDEAADVSSGQGAIIGGLFAGCAVFFGGDWLIDRADGAMVLDVRRTLRTDDGHLIYAFYRGLLVASPAVRQRMEQGEPIAPDEMYFRTTPVFETTVPVARPGSRTARNRSTTAAPGPSGPMSAA